MKNPKHTFASNLLGSEVDPEYRKLSSFAETYTSGSETQKIFVSGEQPPFKWGRIPPGVKVVRSACFSCNTACEVLVFVEEETGKVLRVEGDPESPVTKGVL